MKRGRLVGLDYQAHDLEVAGSNPVPASNYRGCSRHVLRSIISFSEHTKRLFIKRLISASFTKITDFLRYRKRPKHERQITYVKRPVVACPQHCFWNRVCNL